MNNVLDDNTRAALTGRIESITGDEKPLWGQMNVSQMIEHCIRWEEITSGKLNVPRIWLGYLFGKIALKSMTRDDKPVKQSMPTLKELVVADAPTDLKAQKEKWIGLLKAYQHTTAGYFVHPFCGRMTREQTAILAFKHADHHLRQFGR